MLSLYVGASDQVFTRGIGGPRSHLDRYEIALNSTVPWNSRDTSTPAGLGGSDSGSTNDGTTNDGSTKLWRG